MQIYIYRPTGGTVEQQDFFEENYIMEIAAAGYAIAGSRDDSDFYYTLDIQPNANFGEYEDEPEFFLYVRLYDSTDQREIVQLGYGFTEKEEMYDWNLYLVYQAMANVPITKLTQGIHTDHWRNKWIYIVPYLAVTPHIYSNDNPHAVLNFSNSFQPGPFLFGAGVDFEFHIVNWMSLETGFGLTWDWLSDVQISNINNVASDVSYDSGVIQLPLLLKIVLKPSDIFMIEPYAGAGLNFSLNSDSFKAAFVSLLGGIEAGFRLGERGAFFIDTRVGWDLGDSIVNRNRNSNVHRLGLHFGIGYKVGFFNRLKTDLEADSR
jgi:hypothetical protein